MKIPTTILCLALCFSTAAVAQVEYALPACPARSTSGKELGGRIILSLPQDAIVKKGRDIDYSAYGVGFGKKKARVWMQGIYGPLASSGQVPEDWLSASVEVARGKWTFAEIEGVDARGKLENGNLWRYFGLYGESIRYYDVPAEAAEYFDGLLDKACFRAWR